ncbi:symmetrical bis(5'-nucleosyl)-tetraphosphatase [Colwellia psychrerythraea]|uniref:Bis(5'-nucleosyl)-tetraphosphatase, symmetrical n=1 Tax=Colwellia psychrerythraea (strain 34H / ATCC BAA-681) TaxID=167879 RepID=APAH_COLP3|nr:symmetrical bis(5'-nucleosyl)-tetraphosphatase [Colwellia psychrerythraea]Q47VJ7.1 RecName: Full=Bis(5'-nucleosyl)-tetraphosphatase, symmetrical; AltName: Full=Ap4A hydrolase; AltName: Full=Diadenosine 5',5'''-P1,P4-tetraphosphate pyrophosphohydrolase; AltName: Full=Diadenosine tetraphosphatase [Colwellia psychrerythraea 34H]AAZ27360.1 bis(5'-nucleosyl)-tetraphosphatase (symmetrical) [Colwellia psychrerythraea 34H]
MAIYLVGDIQGCFNELSSLLLQVNFDRNNDVLYLAGDLVARGPNSLETLRFVKSLGESAKVVLGNHDLHLLSVHAGIKKAKKSDNLSALLAAPDVNELMDWLAAQPLLQEIPNTCSNSNAINQANNNSAYMSHAGISPQWQLSVALEQAKFIQTKLASSDRNTWLALMYGEKPNDWHQAITEIERFRYSINAFTRMRFCFTDGTLEFEQKDSPENITLTNIVPWYELSQTINNTSWVFGHWASLMGKSSHPNIYPLDTGCVWGNQLTMLRWHDKKYFIQSSELSD